MAITEERQLEIEKDIVALKAGQATIVETLAVVAVTNKETVNKLEALKLSQWPPFLYVITVAGIGATLMGSVLIGLKSINAAQIDEATKVLEYRLNQIESRISLVATWKTTMEQK